MGWQLVGDATSPDRMMVLVDTSVWIDLFARRNLPHVAKLKMLISDNTDLCTCGVVLTEVLQGIRDDHDYRRTRDYLEDLVYLHTPRDVHIMAADIYRSLRARGLTIRNAADCLIAACCIRHGVSLLHNDRDFAAIAGRWPLRIA